MMNINVTDNLLHSSFTTVGESGQLFHHMQMKMAIYSSLWYFHFEKCFFFFLISCSYCEKTPCQTAATSECQKAHDIVVFLFLYCDSCRLINVFQSQRRT